MLITEINIGDRIELDRESDWWAMGVHTATVTAVGDVYVRAHTTDAAITKCHREHGRTLQVGALDIAKVLR